MRIIIVDDEQFSINWIKKLVEQVGMPFQVVGTFLNGKDALDYCRSNPVDILLTDIRMPIMDGIELIKCVRKEKPNTGVIIISAYSEFVYARNALKLKVEDFIIKAEMTKQDLLDSLLLAQRRIQLQMNPSGPVAPLPKWSDWINAAQSRSLSDQDIKAIRVQCQNATGSVNPSMMVIRCGNDEEIRCLYDMTILFFDGMQIPVFVTQIGMHHLLVMTCQADAMQENAAALWAALRQYISSSLRIGYCIGDNDTDAQTILARTAQAGKILDFYEEDAVLNIQRTADSQVVRKEKNAAITAAHNGDCDAVVLHTHAMFSQARRGFLSPEILHGFVYNIFAEILVQIRKYDTTSAQSRIDWTFMESQSQYSVLLQATIDRINTLITTMQTVSRQNRYSLSVRKIIQYLESNYRQDITLNSISDHVHLNRTYVSSVFKKETGENINTYLQRLRINKASEIIKRQNLSIGEVAQAVGIPDAAYFAKLFKKCYGITPSEYRDEPEHRH
jgi:two-component system response regulator YesN